MWRAVVFVASAIADFSRPPTQIFEVFIQCQYNVLALNFFRLFPVFSVMLLVLALNLQ